MYLCRLNRPTTAYGGFFTFNESGKMRYPNSRYGNPEELKYYSQGMPIKALAKKLKRSEKSVKQWLSFEKKVPYWVPELLRLWHMERDITMRQMGFGDQKLKMGIVKDNVFSFSERSRERIDSAGSSTGCGSYPDDTKCVIAPRAQAI